MAFNNFPWTNFHELNLDWVISKIKSLTSYVELLNDEYEDATAILTKLLDTDKLAEALSQLGYPANYIYNYPDNLPGITPIVPSDPTSPDASTYTSLIRDYDTLPYLTKHTWGNDEGGYPLVWYRYEPTSYTHTQIATATGIATGKALYENNHMSCTILCISGIHGDERQSVVGLYAVIKWLMESEESLAKFMRSNFVFLIMPCANPWGYVNNNRYNYDDVDINRNFPPNWDSYSGDHKGTSALSTKSAQCLNSLLSKVSEDTRYTTTVFDFHDVDGDGGYDPYNFINCATLPTAKQKSLYVLTWLYQYMVSNGWSGYLKSDRPLLFTNLSSNPQFIHYAWELGYRNSHLFENRIVLMNGENRYDSISAQMGTLEIAVALTMLAPLVSLEQIPTDIRRLTDLNMTTANSLSEICDALPHGSTLSIYVSTTAMGNSILGSTLPGSVGGVLEINRPLGGSSSAICRFSIPSSKDAISYYCCKSFTGVMSQWYAYNLTP